MAPLRQKRVRDVGLNRGAIDADRGHAMGDRPGSEAPNCPHFPRRGAIRPSLLNIFTELGFDLLIAREDPRDGCNEVLVGQHTLGHEIQYAISVLLDLGQVEHPRRRIVVRQDLVVRAKGLV